jgi:hypothetical protein
MRERRGSVAGVASREPTYVTPRIFDVPTPGDLAVEQRGLGVQ